MLRLPFTITVPRTWGDVATSFTPPSSLEFIPSNSSTLAILNCKPSKEFVVPTAEISFVSFAVVRPFWLYVHVLGVDALMQFSHGATRSHLSFLCRHRRQETISLGRLRGFISSIAKVSLKLDLQMVSCNKGGESVSIKKCGLDMGVLT